MSETKTSSSFSPLILRKSTFISSIDLCELNPNIFKKSTANEELKDHLDKVVDPSLRKVWLN